MSLVKATSGLGCLPAQPPNPWDREQGVSAPRLLIPIASDLRVFCEQCIFALWRSKPAA